MVGWRKGWSEDSQNISTYDNENIVISCEDHLSLCIHNSRTPKAVISTVGSVR